MARWSIDIIRKKGEHLGVVAAPSQREAYLKAMSVIECFETDGGVNYRSFRLI